MLKFWISISISTFVWLQGSLGLSKIKIIFRFDTQLLFDCRFEGRARAAQTVTRPFLVFFVFWCCKLCASGCLGVSVTVCAYVSVSVCVRLGIDRD